mmetsp:Transcript_19877/g.64683  ORF Transcript_19877/g.64683 Transcript_19877/m.64683 type:complete len:260 (+) Transcript_19877:1201-1980(+)
MRRKKSWAQKAAKARSVREIPGKKYSFIVLLASAHMKQWFAIPSTVSASNTSDQNSPMLPAFSANGRRTKLQNFHMSSRISQKLLMKAASAASGHAAPNSTMNPYCMKISANSSAIIGSSPVTSSRAMEKVSSTSSRTSPSCTTPFFLPNVEPSSSMPSLAAIALAMLARPPPSGSLDVEDSFSSVDSIFSRSSLFCLRFSFSAFALRFASSLASLASFFSTGLRPASHGTMYSWICPTNCETTMMAASIAAAWSIFCR